jgi:hypothetical protein
MLDVNLAFLVAREGGVEPGQQTVAAVGRQLFLEEEIAVAMRVAEDEPITARRSDYPPLLKKRTERRDPCTGSDHDDRRIGRKGQPEAVRALHKGSDRLTRRQPVAQKGRGHTEPLPGTLFVAHQLRLQDEPPLQHAWERMQSSRAAAGADRAWK